MLDFANPYPDASRARVIKRQMDTRLLDSFLYLLGRAEDTLCQPYPTTREALMRLQLEVDSGTANLRGTLYASHSQLVDAMRRGAVQKVTDTLEYVPNAFTGSTIRVSPLGSSAFSKEEEATFLATVSTDYNSTYSRPFDGSAPTTAEAGEMSETIYDVLEKLRTSDPETIGEIEAYISDIIPIQSAHINAGTCFKAFGLLYLTVLRDGQDWTTYLENIVHEAAHHHLFALWTVDQIIRSDGNQTYSSPLRTEPRPMSGIYHAMFVLARTIRILSIFRSNPLYEREISSMATGYNQAKNTASLEEKFALTYRTIRENAKLTEVGESLLEGCRQIVEVSSGRSAGALA